MVVGNAEIYIITMKDTCTAGCRSESETTENPAVRVDAIWNRPFMNQIAGDGGLFPCCRYFPMDISKSY